MQTWLFALMFNGSVMAQAAGTAITGVVLDPSGARIADATVRLVVADQTIDELRIRNAGSFP